MEMFIKNYVNLPRKEFCRWKCSGKTTKAYRGKSFVDGNVHEKLGSLPKKEFC
jgi:hypothetical protein